jgi:hypothetical protein
MKERMFQICRVVAGSTLWLSHARPPGWGPRHMALNYNSQGAAAAALDRLPKAMQQDSSVERADPAE